MSRNTTFFLFFLVFSSIYFGINYYVYLRTVNGLGLSPPLRNCLKIFFYLAGSSFLVGEFLSRKIVVSPLIYLGALWLGVVSIAFSVFLLKDILGLFFPGRTKLLTIVALVIISSLSVFSLYNSARETKIKEIKIRLSKFNPQLSGFSLVQLSDLHLGILTSKKWLSSVVEKTNRLNPDLIVITGDLIDRDIRQFAGFSEILSGLKAKYGVLAITGNHEFYAGIDNFLEIAKKSNFKVLRNEKITVAEAIEIVGLDDPTGKTFGRGGPDLELAMRDCDWKKPIILLAHQPRNFVQDGEKGIGLQLSGHTHGGQIPPIDLLVFLLFKYPYGLYSSGASYIYTTSGTGTWGPPMRLFSRSEIVKIILLRQNTPLLAAGMKARRRIPRPLGRGASF